MDKKDVEELEDFIDRRMGESDRREKTLMSKWFTPATILLVITSIAAVAEVRFTVQDHEGQLKALHSFDDKTEERYDEMSLQMQRVVVLLDQIERRISTSETRMDLHVKEEILWNNRIVTLEERGKNK